MVGYRVKKMDNSWAIYNNSRGIHILELNATTCLPKNLNIFDVVASTSEETRFQNYIDKQAPNGSYMIGYSVGNACTTSTIIYISKRFQMVYDMTSTNAMAFIYVKGGSRECYYQMVQNSYGLGLVVFIPSELSNNLFRYD